MIRDHDAWRLGIHEALAALADGRLAAGDYLDACLARAAALEPRVAAFAWLDADRVRSAAAAGASGALAHIPVGIKDIIATRGVPTEMGSAAFRGHVAERSATVVERLADAGAVMFGKTVTTEFAWRHPGPTRNPWHLEHTPGGSSSGSAAAVAYGAVPGALGTQTLGSVLRPAAFCGVVGFKPSYGSIPRTGVHPLAESLDHVGVFTRDVADAALLASVLTGNDGVDFRHWAPLAAPYPLRMPDRPPRIALLRTRVWDRASAEQRALVESVAARLAADGAAVTPLELPPSFDGLWEAARLLCDAEGGAANAAFAAAQPPRISEPSLALVARGRALSAFEYQQAKATQRALTFAFAEFGVPFDALLTAPALGEAPAGLADTGDAVFCTPATLLGAPAISLPAGSGPRGLPLGIQLIGAWADDRRLLETALWVERALAWSPGFPHC